jgi:hypothetical protein
MADLSPTWIKIKGVLFLITGAMAGTIMMLDHPSLKNAILLAITVWCFCRAYYFAFYVIEHYVDSTYKYAGLIDFVKYFLLGQRSR